MNLINAIKRAVLASTTSTREGARLVGTSSKSNLGGATNVEAALTSINTYIGSAVSHTEFEYLDGATSNLQAQISALAAGSVSSIAASSPLASSGGSTPTISISNQSANVILAGPGTGGAAAPTFRALVAADIPDLSAEKLTSGTVATARLGSGTANGTTFLRGDNTWAAPTVALPVLDANSNELLTGTTTVSAVNQINVTNATTTNGPTLGVAGDDTNIDLKLAAKGTGHITFGAGTNHQVAVEADGSTITLNLALSDIQMPAALGGNRTIAVSNAKIGQKFAVRLLQDATGGRTITWFGTIKWAGGAAPTLTVTANKADWIGFICTGSGTYDGFVLSANH